MIVTSDKAEARAVTDGNTILATVEVTMPPERVFRALVSDEVERWWGSAHTYRMTNWKSDLRVGGRWSVVVQNADGQALPASGEYVEIEPPRKVVLTRRYEWDFPELGRRATMVKYRLDAVATGTRVTVRHDGFGGLRAAADQHAEGWERVLGWHGDYSRREGAADRRRARGQ